jgi:transcriptional regulator with XRE-family HTH domain
MTEGALRPDPALQLLGVTIRQYRKQRGLTQRALAAKMGMHHRYVSKIELGRHNIAVLMLLRLAHAFDIPAACLLAQVDTHAPLAPSVTCHALTSQEERAVTHDDTPSPQPGDPAILLPRLGATIRHYRRQVGFSQALFATKTSLSHTYITEIEQGHRNLSVLSLVRIADALGLSVAPLLAPLETCQSPSSPLTS